MQHCMVTIAALPDWTSAYDALPVAQFQFNASNGITVQGCWVSSMDSTGRRFPFAVFACVEPDDGIETVPPWVILAFEPLLSNATHLLYAARSGEPAERVLEAVSGFRVPDRNDFILAEKIYGRFLQHYTLADVEQALVRTFPEFNGNACLERLAICRALAAGARDGVRMPLPAETGIAHLTLGFWLALAQWWQPARQPWLYCVHGDFLRPTVTIYPRADGSGHLYLASLLPWSEQARGCFDVLDVHTEAETKLLVQQSRPAWRPATTLDAFLAGMPA